MNLVNIKQNEETDTLFLLCMISVINNYYERNSRNNILQFFICSASENLRQHIYIRSPSAFLYSSSLFFYV